jgi:dihydrofolate reductase
MRRIINSTYITLDGVVEAPHLWPSLDRGSDPRADDVQGELLFSADALLMGRHTYDGFAPVWSARSGDPFSDRFNAMPKYVVSTTLQDPEWTNTTVIAADVAGEIERLKAADGKAIVQYGFGPVTRLLLERDLLDELRLWFHPLLLGRGEPGDLLFGAVPASAWRLVDTTALSNGIVILAYELDKRLDD